VSLSTFRHYIAQAQGQYDFSSRMTVSIDNMIKVRVIMDTPGGWPRLVKFEYKDVVNYAADWVAIMRRLRLPELKKKPTGFETSASSKTVLHVLSQWGGA
jgi:hypothetical protein